MSVNIVDKSTGNLIKIAGNPIEQASGISYDHTSSGMQANNVQAAVDELKSGLINVADDVKLNTQDLTTPSRTKNLLPMTVDGIKAANTDGTWSGNAYTISGVTFTLLTDDNNVIGIETNGTSTNDWVIFVLNADFALPAGTYAGNGVSGGNSSTYRIDVNCFSISITNGDILTTIPDTTSIYAQIVVRTSGTDVSNKTFYPMIRLSTETDDTFAPYIPSVESRLEAVESGLNDVNSDFASLFTNMHTADAFQGDSVVKYVVLGKVVAFYAKITKDQASWTVAYGLPKPYADGLVGYLEDNYEATWPVFIYKDTSDGRLQVRTSSTSIENKPIFGIYVTE